MKFGVKKTEKFGWKGVKGWSMTVPKKASFSYIEVTVAIPLRKNIVNDRVYFVAKGSMKFFKGNKTYVIKEKEAIFIPKNTRYSYTPLGKTILVEMNTPPFSLANEKIYNK